MNSLNMPCCNSATHLSTERVCYFPRQLLTADDLRAEQKYFREKLRRHNRLLHGWGVVCGCEVIPAPTAERPWQVRVCPGYVLCLGGDEIEVPRPTDFDLAGNWYQTDPCSQPSCPPTQPPPAGDEPVSVYLAICYTECSSRPVRIHPAGCGCDEAACEYSRIRESFELVRLSEWPESHRLAAKADKALCKQFKDWIASEEVSHQYDCGEPKPSRPAFSCQEPSAERCVVLAQITLPAKRTSWIGGKTDGGTISYEGRRVLYSTRTLQELCDCIPHATPEIAVSVRPKTVNVNRGETQEFIATVTGSANKAVTWSVQEEVAGGNITATGLYTAPKAEGTYHVVATSQADPAKFDVATVLVVEPISIVIQPKNAALEYFDVVPPTQQFTAMVRGSANMNVAWKVQEGAGFGTITAAGLYTASEATKNRDVHIVATSQADPSKSDTATITIVAPN